MCKACSEDQEMATAGACYECQGRICWYDEYHVINADGAKVCSECKAEYPEHVCSLACEDGNLFDATFSRVVRVGNRVVRVF